MNRLQQFFSREAGQQRRAALENRLADLAQYYLGPTGLPERINALGLLNPVNDMEQASQNAQRVYRGETDAIVPMLTDMATVLAPVAGARMAGGDATAAVVDSLLGMGGPTREGLDDAARHFVADESGALTLWHGSPHDFDRFSMDKIGTGEGAQAYGHGLYFAENRGVAEGYRDTLTDPGNFPLQIGGKPLNTVWNDELRANFPSMYAGLSEDAQDAMDGILGTLQGVSDPAQAADVVKYSMPREWQRLATNRVLPKFEQVQVGQGRLY